MDDLAKSEEKLLEKIEADMQKIDAEIELKVTPYYAAAKISHFCGDSLHFCNSVFELAQDIYDDINDKLVETMETNLHGLYDLDFSWISRNRYQGVLEIIEAGERKRYSGKFIDIFYSLQQNYNLVVTNA